jgi:hypothetical protein
MPDLKFIDLQKGQMEKKEQNYPMPLPACLVEFKQVNWSNTTGGQLGDSTISVYLYVDLVTDSFNNSELENETIDLLDNLDKVYESLQDFSGDSFGPLNRTDDAIQEYGKRYVCYRTDFRTTLLRYDSEQKTAETPGVKIGFKFSKKL